jgi:hypothetical protein
MHERRREYYDGADGIAAIRAAVAEAAHAGLRRTDLILQRPLRTMLEWGAGRATLCPDPPPENVTEIA